MKSFVTSEAANSVWGQQVKLRTGPDPTQGTGGKGSATEIRRATSRNKPPLLQECVQNVALPLKLSRVP